MITTAIFSLYTDIPDFYLSRTELALWWLAVHHARPHFTRLDLMTDHNGRNLLLNELGFSFDRVREFSDFPKKIRHIPTAGKFHALRALASENTPAVHIDGDVILWRPLPERLLSSEFFVQSPFMLSSSWKKIYPKLKLPEHWKRKDQLGYNSGIIGSNNPEKLKAWTDDIIPVIEENAARLSHYMDSFVSGSIPHHFPKIEMLFLEETPPEMEFVAAGYTHAAAKLKKSPEIRARVAARMQRDHPDAWKRIEARIKTIGPKPSPRPVSA